MKNQVVVIGAGLTGLTTAFYLKKAGVDVVVLEKKEQPGGVIQTHHENGFVFESGPNTGVLGSPEAAELMEDLKEHCTLEIANPEAKRRLILKHGKWHDIPSGLIGGITTPLFSWYDKFRLLGEPFRKPGTNPHESLADLVKRRMGQSFLDYAIDPFILGVYAGDPSLLVPKYALPKLYNLEQDFGSFVGGAVKKSRMPKTDREKKATRDVFSVEGGLTNMINALVKEIGEDCIQCNCQDLTVEYIDANNYRVKTGDTSIETPYVVTTSGAHTLPSMLNFIEPSMMDKIANLKYARVIEAAIGFNDWQGGDIKAFGGLIPFKENRDILGVLFMNSFLKNRAPEKGALLTVFMGGVRKEELANANDEEAREIIGRELTDLMKLPEFKPDLFKLVRYDYAIPQYGADSGMRFATVEQLEQQYQGLIIAGNLRDGIGMADRIKQGRTIAAELSEQFK
ncbi:protoporphyrinogen oxidase [Puteibacter caeruleilacunae]|nr:protoporphyrinogen oxidase [Puteibacter caeruleilacunae]